MAPPHREIVVSNETLSKARPSAVLILLYCKDNEPHLVLTLRTDTLGSHKGQIALPGGSKDKTDATFVDTALRETREELGIDLEQVEILRELTPMYVPPSNFLIHPIVAYTSYPPTFNPNIHEVAEVIEVPLLRLFDPMNRRIEPRPAASLNGQMIQVPGFDLGKYLVWGATAMILAEFVNMLRNQKQYTDDCKQPQK
jgi:8-oxo-dGTP pyrophosphatase MutT (NUDIX family)